MPFYSTQPASQPNMMTTPFDHNNAAHITFVTQELDKFKEARDALYAIDNRMMLWAAIDTVLLYFGGTPTALIAVALECYFVCNPFSRQEPAKVFNNKRDHMMEVYHWMVKDKPATIIQNNIYMNVATTMTPFMPVPLQVRGMKVSKAAYKFFEEVSAEAKLALYEYRPALESATQPVTMKR